MVQLADTEVASHELAGRLARAEARAKMLEGLLECVPGIVWDFADGPGESGRRLRFIGPQVEALLGYPREAWDGTPNFWQTILHPDDAAAVQARGASRADDAGEPGAVEYRLIAKDGSLVWFEVRAIAARDESGAQTGSRGLAIDVTARKRVEQELANLAAEHRRVRERLEGLLASLPALVWEVLVRDGTVEWEGAFANDYIETLLGYTREEWLSDPNFWLTVVHPDDRERAAQESNAVAASGGGASQFRCVRRDGRVVWVESQLRTIKDEPGRTIGLRGVWTDITARKDAEREQAAARLREEVIRMHEARLAELSTPLIPISDQIMVMPLIGVLDSVRAERVIATLLRGIAGTRAQVAILDITGVPSVDTAVAAALMRAARAAQLVGAQVVITGIRPEVASALVSLEVDLKGIITHGDLQSGIAYAMKRAVTTAGPRG